LSRLGENDFTEAVALHRAAVAECVAAFAAVPNDVWNRPLGAGRWSPAEIAEHLAIAYEPPLSELSGGSGFAIRVPWWKRRALRWAFLPGILNGGFPAGAPAPREIRPKRAAASPEEASRSLSDNAERFLATLAEARTERRVRLTHPYFGKLRPAQTVMLLTSHALHHRRQLPGPGH
jgi:uncharacterized damage-inducible protein DinB